MGLMLIAGLLLVAAIALIATALLMSGGSSSGNSRIASIDSYTGRGGGRAMKDSSSRLSSVSEQLLDLGERAMKDRESTTRTMELITRADLPLRAGEWLAIRIAAVVLLGVLGMVMIGSFPLLGLAAGAALGFFGPSFALGFLAKRRASKFESQLPDIFMLVATSLRSGFGLPQALDSIARQAAEPARKEFARALAETRIGTDLSDALERMSIRMDSTAAKWAVMAIRIQREVGGNLADTLLTTARTLRERETLQRQVKTLSAEGKLSGYILVMMPIGIFGYMTMSNPNYISKLWTTTLGLGMLAGAVVLLVAGILWMRQTIKIEV